MRTLGMMLMIVAGCGVDEPASVVFTSPAAGSTFTRDQLGPTGALVADVGVALEVHGDVARVAITSGDVAFGDVDAGNALHAGVSSAGSWTLTATAFDDAGMPLASSDVEIAVFDPEVAGCHAWLDLYQLDYSTGPANLGIADPITVKLSIDGGLNGLAYRYSGNAEPRKTLYGDCTLMKSLAEAAPILRGNDVKEIVDIGIYNYRCIDQTKTPPNCSMSQHAYAKAIDLAELVTTDDTHYSVLTDWVIDTTGDTCTSSTENAKDAFLHQMICALKAANVWNIVLTPNYNSDHRNHFHVDLTNGSDFIKRTIGGDDPALFGD